jgi:hypothetical protein
MCLFFHIIINELIFSIKLNEENTQNTNLRDLCKTIISKISKKLKRIHKTKIFLSPPNTRLDAILL